MGACPRSRPGSISFFDPKRVVAFPQLSLASGAIKGWDRRNQFYFQMLQSLGKHYGFDLDKPFDKLPERIQQMILYGSDKEKIAFQYLSDRGKTVTREHAFEGIIPNLERRYRETDSIMVREELAKYLNSKPCPECEGTRLRREARHVKVGPPGDERALYEISNRPLKEADEFFRELKLKGERHALGDKICQGIVSRLQFLNNVGLDYLSLDRSAETLSGGESQRIRLASQIGSGLTGVMYVLDEPSIGLHQRDNDRLLTTLKHLRDLGNSVIVVEHDTDAILSADHVVDMGPGAGEHGGQIVAQGTPDEIRRAAHSLTGQYLAGHRQIPIPAHRHKADLKRVLTITGATGNNLKNITLNLPVGVTRLRDLRFSPGQVDADQRYALPRGGQAPVRQHRRAGAVRGDARHRALRQGDQRRPESDRPHAPVESGDLHRTVHADPRAVRAGQGGARARLRTRTLFVQRQGRPLRGLPGRWADQGRDAFSAGRLRVLRRLPRTALQPRDAGDPVQGQEYP
jgi:excinuclease ABC subunit A